MEELNEEGRQVETCTDMSKEEIEASTSKKKHASSKPRPSLEWGQDDWGRTVPSASRFFDSARLTTAFESWPRHCLEMNGTFLESYRA
uniref:Uncharacterized protein n=1 Tax=Vespula pensylvanica TaxID=30213 RepID=A0A834UB42_VESPE|nr:hypothetical protein H0235_007064 [Vespula pensylvanica]